MSNLHRYRYTQAHLGQHQPRGEENGGPTESSQSADRILTLRQPEKAAMRNTLSAVWFVQLYMHKVKKKGFRLYQDQEADRGKINFCCFFLHQSKQSHYFFQEGMFYFPYYYIYKDYTFHLELSLWIFNWSLLLKLINCWTFSYAIWPRVS